MKIVSNSHLLVLAIGKTRTERNILINVVFGCCKIPISLFTLIL